MSVENFPVISTGTVFQKESVSRVRKFKTETQKQQKAARWQRATSFA